MITMVIKLSKYNIQYKKKQPPRARHLHQTFGVPNVTLRPGPDALILGNKVIHRTTLCWHLACTS